MALWPLTRRMLGWAFVMACSWGWFPFLFGGELGLLYLLVYMRETWGIPADDPSREGDGFFWALIMPYLLMLILACLWAMGGGITGALVGILAPANEPKNPLKSPVFRSVGQKTFWVWFWSSLGLSFVFFVYFNLPEMSRVSRYLANWPGVAIYFFGLLASFTFSLWRAVSGVLKLAKDNSL